MNKILLAIVTCILLAGPALAVPEIVSVRVTDLTATSLSLVWMTDVDVMPSIEVYGDPAMTNRLDGGLQIAALPDVPVAVAAAARSKGIMKVRVAGLQPDSTYYVRAVTRDTADPQNVGYSQLLEVKTASAARPYRTAADGTLEGVANDLLAMQVYIRPADTDPLPGTGDLLVVTAADSPWPVSVFVGAGTVSREGIVDLNNLVGNDLTSLALNGGERLQVLVYRGDSLTTRATLEPRTPLATLTHYRRLPAPDGTGLVTVQAPQQGFFADVNLDGRIDDADFTAFRGQYRTAPNDGAYNPDFNFFADPAGIVDVQDFAKFAREYGRTDVP